MTTEPTTDPTRRNHLAEALKIQAARLEHDLSRHLSEERRLAMAGACLLVADHVDQRIAKDIPEGPERDVAMMQQMVAREILGAISCARLVLGDESEPRSEIPEADRMPEEEQVSLVDFVIAMADALIVHDEKEPGDECPNAEGGS